ncbi:MAG: hypothetical protein C0620_09420 [Desulfuromonas sp.]|nr:MAG: hypothetical protein C0620_09420 [Desulfuromonas sp.]
MLLNVRAGQQRFKRGATEEIERAAKMSSRFTPALMRCTIRRPKGRRAGGGKHIHFRWVCDPRRAGSKSRFCILLSAYKRMAAAGAHPGDLDLQKVQSPTQKIE